MAEDDPVFKDISYEDNGNIVMESLCTNCFNNGTTKLLLTKIPQFKEVILMSFECPHCGFSNNEVQSGAALQDTGCRIGLNVKTLEDLDRQVIKSEHATIKLNAPDLDFEIPAQTQRGVSTTVEGLISKAVEGLSQGQSEREPELAEKIQVVISRLRKMHRGEELEFLVTLEDPSGNSYIQGESLKRTYFERTPAHLKVMGFSQETTTREKKQGADMPEHLKATNWDFTKSLEENVEMKNEEKNNPDILCKDESISFPTNCSHCNVPGDQNVCLIDIPGFRECLIMAFTCEACGARTNEVKAAGAIGEKGKRWTLQVSCEKDLNRDVLKSEMAAFRLPGQELEMEMGTHGSSFTTVEGLLIEVAGKLKESNPFSGDSAAAKDRETFQKVINDIENLVKDPSAMPFTLVIDDPCDHSFIGKREPDKPEIEEIGLMIEEYERSEEQIDALGLLEMKTEDYEEQEEEPPLKIHNSF